MKTQQPLIDEPLALLGGPKAVPVAEPELFHWPIVTAEDEMAVVEVLRAGTMSDIAITQRFESEWAAYQGVKYALGHCNGTASLLAALFGVGVQRGDEVICPSITYWASALVAFPLGATPVFADIDPQTLCIDPEDIAHRITPRTKAIVVVHYCGHPCDMDAIMAVARRHGVKVVEDVSHAQGAMYKGRMCGSIGDVAGMSMMARKSFSAGEAGMLCTNDRTILDRAIAFGHYERTQDGINDASLRKFSGMPLGGYKFRMNQTCSAMGRVQLRHYPKRTAEIRSAMNRFWDLLDGVPGIRPHRPSDSSMTMGGWYNPVGHYLPEELGGLRVDKFIEALNAEGGLSGRGGNLPIHLHPVVNEADVFGDGKPTRIAFAARDVREKRGSLPHSERLAERCIGVPYFKHDRPEAIARYAAAFRKVALRAGDLLKHHRNEAIR